MNTYYVSTNRSNKTFKKTKKYIYCRFLLRNGNIRESKIIFSHKDWNCILKDYVIIECNQITYLTVNQKELINLI